MNAEMKQPFTEASRSDQKEKLNLHSCYQRAWKGFRKGWVILCLISAAIVAFELTPRMIVTSEWSSLRKSSLLLVQSLIRGDEVTAARLLPLVRIQSRMIIRRLFIITTYLFPAIALLTILLLMRASRAVKKEKREKERIIWLIYISFVHVLLAVIKLAAFFLFIVPGVYLYVRLIFVSLVMLEERLTARQAIRRSWELTRGSFFRILFLVVINTVIQITATLTILGLIPSTGFINTARAAAFHQLRERGSEQRDG